ncbi:F0F1 ATP synthase subunit delta [Roseateles asaccharophilus]|uniref:ATP synthase subunit delta n=1 Tax=Roseateles asaccharophilus TaxID=582607 RepID=A0ABU2A830_9BURK|nr:F0F1 ATP synthase subunit delta [Roseateles asaccharophilus]MDR7332773.1 F-type H+-transporting ATPase subunit delta [Roseateles asaccharophilus]
MAELATIARPYAEALFQVARNADLTAWRAQLDALATVAGDAALRQFAEDPKVAPDQVVGVAAEVAEKELGQALLPGVRNFLQTVVENRRLEALPAAVAQFHTLAAGALGVSEAQVESAYPLDAAQLAELTEVLQKRFGRKLTLSVSVDPALIGGVRATVGDEVLDTSVRARLERMKTALIA